MICQSTTSRVANFSGGRDLVDSYGETERNYDKLFPTCLTSARAPIRTAFDSSALEHILINHGAN